MARQGVTLMCYWNGRTTNGQHGISYEGAAPKPIRVNYGITHNQLLDKIYGLTGFDKQQFKVKIICRYPACREYILVPIEDDESIDIMFDVARQPGTNCMELYVEKEPVCFDSHANLASPTHIDKQIPTEMAIHDSQVDNFLDPGPIDNSVLVLQNQHRSEAIWTGEDPGVLTCRQSLATMMREWPLDPRIRRFVIQSGFYGVYRIGFIQIDWPLITALVERWRQETHTFHFAVGESTVTLQDVAVLLGLQIQGHAVTGKSDLRWDDLCEELLGVRPDPNVLHGSALKLSWLRANFQQPPPSADEATLQCYARAYILGLMGGVLFTDKSGADVQLIFLSQLRCFTSVRQLSWGSATLAHLYRELCRASKIGANEIAGPLILLQLWAWERLYIGRPERFGIQVQGPVVRDHEEVGEVELEAGDTAVEEEQLPAYPLGCKWKASVIRRDNPQRALIFYRDQLDQQTDDQIIWQPYTSERLASLPDICVREQHVWRTIAPLICFDIIEWHRPDRVLRQFGLFQEIPVPCDTEAKLHSIDRRGRHHYDWRAYHGQYIQLWEAREKSVAVGKQEEHAMHYHDPYLEWYRSITRRLITPLTQGPHMRIQPSSGMTHLLVKSLTTIHNQCTTTLRALTSDSATRALTDIRTTCTRVLQMIGETRHLESRPAHVQATPAISITQTSPENANDVEGRLQHIHEEVSPLLALTPATTKATSIRGRSKGKNRGRGRATPHTRAAAFPCSSPPSVPGLGTAPLHRDDLVHLEVLSRLNQEETALAEESQLLEGEKEAETAPPSAELDNLLNGTGEMETTSLPPPDGSKNEVSQLTQVDTCHGSRPKKKSKQLRFTFGD